ncbi:MAG: PAS domain S-box protein, partial [Acidobacteria bacterium]|nr:PAS domain S-box protein [Acidobacteriota bacterium]
VDREGVIRQVNSTWDEAARNNELASPESVAIGTSYLDVCPDQLRAKLRKVIEGDSLPIGLEYPSHLPERERWFLMKAAPLSWSDGGAVISHVDITSRVLTERALERREREYRSIVETMGEGLLSLDLEGRLVFANRRFCEISGYSISELRGRNTIDLLVDSAEQPAANKQVQKTLRGASTVFRTKISRKDGSERWVDVSTVPRYDSDGRIVGRLSVVSDITEKRAGEQEQERLRRQIEELNRIESLGKLAGNMAHEFNNVLMGIHPFTEVIRRLSGGNQKIQQATQFVTDAVQRGRRVSQEVLRFARPTPLERTDVEIALILRQVEQMGGGIVANAHSLAVEPSAEPWTVSVDREQILQVFTNLMINACDAMSSGGTITISVTRDRSDSRYGFGVVDQPGHYVHLVVSDTGCGMTPDQSQKIFEPMFTTKRTGTGLGLAIVHQIMTAHEGYIFVDSRPGEGTSFHLFLPLSGIAAAMETDDPIFAAGK